MLPKSFLPLACVSLAASGQRCSCSQEGVLRLRPQTDIISWFSQHLLSGPLLLSVPRDRNAVSLWLEVGG